MKQMWLEQLARIDSLSIRERIFLFISILMCCGALVDTFWLSPARLAHKQLLVQLDKQSTELQRLRDTLRTSARPMDASQSVRAQLQQTQTEMDQVDQEVKKLLPGAAGSTPLAQALVHLLRRYEGLTLVRTTALAAEVAGPGNSQGVTALPAGLTRQGVALTVSGPYAELTRYVASLEQAMPSVRWGSMTLVSDKGPPELTLQLFLIAESAP
jgi:MSHA biogenesis protein MshJ